MTHRPRRRFGQHFLENEAILDRMVDVMSVRPSDRVLEIGPGLGALTERLVEQAERLMAVEIDRDVAALLKSRFPTLDLMVDDILRVDLNVLLGDHDDWRIIGNLPYNISTPLLGRLFAQVNRLRDVHVLLQAEVVDRLTANPGTKEWGRLSIAAQMCCQVDALFAVEPEHFRPPPKVNSTFVRLLPSRAAPLPADAQVFDQVVRLAFQQRRKTLRNALKTLSVDWERTRVAATDRADMVDIAGYVELANAVAPIAGTDDPKK